MRASALALAAVVLAAGCGGSKSQDHLSGSGPTIKSILERPGPDVQIVPGTSDYAAGRVRFSFLVIRPNGSPVYTPTARVFVAQSGDSVPVTTTIARLEPVGVPGATLDSGDVTHLYVSHFAVPKAGAYAVAAEPLGGPAIQAAGELDVKERAASPAIGSRAIRSHTPTLASTHGDVRALTTREPPDRALLRYSVAGSLAAHAPFVVTFATPKLCTSRTCGPVVDVVQSVARRFRGSGIRFIHVEVYKDNDPTKGYNRWMREWRLPTEPWTFLVGRDGRVKAKFEGSVSAGELSTAVREQLAG